MSTEPDCLIATCPLCGGLVTWASLYGYPDTLRREAARARRRGLVARLTVTDEARQLPYCRCAQAQAALPGTGEAT